MKKLAQALFFLFSAIALGFAVYFYLGTRAESAEASRAVADRSAELGAAGGSRDGDSRPERESPNNRISALPNELVLTIDTVNLDQDEGEEQILTVRKTDRNDGRLWIVVADYVPSRRSWVRAWEGETLATKLTTFAVQVKDLVGDHFLALACFGMDDANRQTLTIFTRSGTPEAELLSYTQALALSADAANVEELERSEGYQLGQTNGVSWPVLAWSNDPESGNILDQVKRRYDWDFSAKAYRESSSERIPGAQVAKEMAAKVLTGVPADFENFLRGVWYAEGGDPADPKTRLVVFDREAGSIVFFSRSSQEVFTWQESHPTRAGIYVSASNESVTNLRRLMDIELTGTDSVSIRVFEDLKMKIDAEDRWDGAYRKRPITAGSAVRQAARGSSALDLGGIWRSAAGGTLSFEQGRRFVRDEGSGAAEGAYSLYEVGGATVLELISFDRDGKAPSRRSFKILVAETKRGKERTRSMRLQPVRVGITGVEILEETELAYEQKLDG